VACVDSSEECNLPFGRALSVVVALRASLTVMSQYSSKIFSVIAR